MTTEMEHMKKCGLAPVPAHRPPGYNSKDKPTVNVHSYTFFDMEYVTLSNSRYFIKHLGKQSFF